LEDLGVDGKVILRLIFKEEGGRVWTGFIWFRLENSGWFF
jgi:hypothetical protein